MFSEMQVIGQVKSVIDNGVLHYLYTQFNLGFIICKLESDLFIVDQVIRVLSFCDN